MRTRYVDPLERRWLFAVVVPSGFTDELFDNGLAGATAMEFAPDGRLFVAEQGGNVRVIENGNLLANSFVSLNVDSAGERGVLGLAFDPAFLTNGFLYLYYTVPNGADGSSGAFNRVSRFTAADADGNPANGYTPGNLAAAGSETILLNLNPLSGATNHNGGALHFGPDGKLYLAVGENANPNNAQTLANHHGKILRLNVDGSAPADNPFNDADATPNEPRDYIWALGLRNPFTTAFDPVTGLFYINDVGAGSWEEVNQGAVGANYGWPTYEGPENDPNFGTPPIFAYSHGATGNDGGNVISGGTFYRPTAHAFPSQYTGDYFFAEAGRGWIRSFDVATQTATLFATNASFPVDLKAGNDGALYYLERGSGSVRRIRFTNPPPQVTNIFVGSTEWNPAFTSHLQATGAGEPIWGFAIPPSDQLNELPWVNLNQVSIRFSRNVVVGQGSLSINGVNVPSYAINFFAYDVPSRTATWRVESAAIGNDKLALTLTGVTDAATGAALDGEWTNPTSPAVGGADTFSSGNGDAGGTFRFRVNVLPGDANRSGGSVIGSDVILVRNAQNSPPGGANSLYTIFKDVNGSASILGSDVTAVRNRQGLSLPPGEPALVTSESSSKVLTAATVVDMVAPVVLSDRKRIRG